MSYEDLEEHNVFLPQDAWGEADLTTTINEPLLLGVFSIGIGGCILMWRGNGSWLTWAGACLFVLFMYVFLFVSNSGIERQNKEINQLIEKSKKK